MRQMRHPGCMDDRIIFSLMDATGVDVEDKPHDIIEKFLDLGLIERHEGKWVLTELGCATLESMNAKKQ